MPSAKQPNSSIRLNRFISLRFHLRPDRQALIEHPSSPHAILPHARILSAPRNLSLSRYRYPHASPRQTIPMKYNRLRRYRYSANRYNSRTCLIKVRKYVNLPSEIFNKCAPSKAPFSLLASMPRAAGSFAIHISHRPSPLSQMTAIDQVLAGTNHLSSISRRVCW